MKERVGDALDIEVYPSAQLFRDRDVARALRQGAVEMAIPGTWVLDGIEPSLALTSLPMFYGQDEEVTRRLIDGDVGKAIAEKTEERLRVHIPGPWLDLGFQSFFTVSDPIETTADIEGMKVRIPGGSANAKRIEGLGGIPNAIAWPDVPLALSSKTVDAVTSSHESIKSAQLWDSGLSYAYDDRQYFAQYVPMIASSFWDGLDEETRTAITEVWAEVAAEERKAAAEAQTEAMRINEEHGITIVTPSAEELAAAREKLMPLQAGLVEEMGIDPELVETAQNALRDAGAL